MITESQFRTILNKASRTDKLENMLLYALPEDEKDIVVKYLIHYGKPVYDAVVLPIHEKILNERGYTLQHTHANGIAFRCTYAQKLKLQTARNEAVIRQQRRNIRQFYKENFP